MPTNPWASAAVYSDRVSAEVALGLLLAADVPCYIVSDEFVPGMGSRFSVRVPPERQDEAVGIITQDPISEQELANLAMSRPRDKSSDT